jgi:hypothetical protein
MEKSKRMTDREALDLIEAYSNLYPEEKGKRLGFLVATLKDHFRAGMEAPSDE